MDTCPICGIEVADDLEVCLNCGWLLLNILPIALEEAQQSLEEAKAKWQQKLVEQQKLSNWINHKCTLKYMLEAAPPNLLVYITTPVQPPFQLPATVLVGRLDRVPTSPKDGMALLKSFPPVRLGLDGGKLSMLLNELQGKAWLLRLFFQEERHAKVIRLLHTSVQKK
jgi:hypothetical protein